MYSRRRARRVGVGQYEVLGRDGRTRYEVSVGEVDGVVTCTCPAGQHGRPCYHGAVALRHLRNHLRRAA
jgi:uncharacterized Zn finger protein